jgi:hypothetical protein
VSKRGVNVIMRGNTKESIKILLTVFDHMNMNYVGETMKIEQSGNMDKFKHLPSFY